MANKGSKQERAFCVSLSNWWTGGERDDIFWRASTSGARATTRTKSGKETYGQHGDVAATHPSGLPLIDILTIELKKGYQKNTAQDILDRTDNLKQQKWEEWITKTAASAKENNSYSWCIICQRDRRKPLMVFERHLYRQLIRMGGFAERVTPLLKLDCLIHGQEYRLVGMPSTSFFQGVSPKLIRHFSKMLKEQQC